MTYHYVIVLYNICICHIIIYMVSDGIKYINKHLNLRLNFEIIFNNVYCVFLNIIIIIQHGQRQYNFSIVFVIVYAIRYTYV